MRMISKAINSLCPSAEFSIENEDYSTIIWLIEPDTIPTLEELEFELDKIESEENDKLYQSLRRSEYPPISDQIDMIWHAMDNGGFPIINDFYETIKEIKNKYPKP